MKYFILTIFSFFPAIIFAQSAPQIIHAICPDSTAFDDLAFLKNDLKNVNIIGLGEQSHGDGATFSAKVRLIKYLHEEQGFDVMAFESGAYDCKQANEAMEQGISAKEALFKAIFGIWDCKEVEQLASYMDACRKAGKPLLLIGFDCQFNGAYSRNELLNQLQSGIAGASEKAGKPIITDSIHFSAAIRKVVKFSNFFNKLPVSDTAVIAQTFDAWRNALSGDSLQWLNLMANIQIDYRRKFDGTFMRDSMMAQNMIFQEQVLKGRKIMLWAASKHLAFNLQSVSGKYFNGRSMGDYLKEKYIDNYYAMLFTSFEGKSKIGFLNIGVGKPADKGIEQWFHGFQQPYLYLNLHGRPGPDDAMGNSKVFGHKAMDMNLATMADGLFYIDKMLPISSRK